MAKQDSQHISLLGLPNEVVSNILAHLDEPSPFQLSISEQPRRPAHTSQTTSLKTASLLSHRIRRLALPVLFKHAYLEPAQVKSFLSFVNRADLAVRIISVVTIQSSPYSHTHPPWWLRLLDTLPNLSDLSIVAPPHIFAELTRAPQANNDAWAFNMPYHILSLSCSPIPSQPSPSLTPQSLFQARSWTSFLVNEGSSLAAYTTYEYFLRHTPSMLVALLPHAEKYWDFVSNLKHFSFVAIFPTYRHTSHVLNLVKSMNHLESLAVKLIPSPDSTILHDELEAAGRHLDVNDPWSEFETGLRLVADACRYLSVSEENEMNAWGMPRLGRLRELRVEDVKMTGVKDMIEESVSRDLEIGDGGSDGRRGSAWEYKGEGIWKRDERPTRQGGSEE